MNEKQQQRMLEMLKTFEGSAVQPDELAKMVKVLLEVIKHLKGQLEKQVADTGSILKKDIQSLEKDIRELEDRTTSALGTVSNTTRQFSLAETARIVSKIQKEMDTMRGMMPEMPDLSEIQNGIATLKNVKIPTVEELEDKLEKNIPKLGLPIRDALELLPEGERLKIEAIENLREELDELKKKILKMTAAGNTVYVGGSAGGGRIVRSYDISASLNGILKTFSLPAFYRIISVHSSSFPDAFRETIDWTSDGSAMTITFTYSITASSTLASNQTVTIVYSEA